MTRILRRLGVACTLALLTLPAVAGASTISVQGGTLVIDAESQSLDIDAFQDGSGYGVYDYTGQVKAGSGCSAATPDPLAVVTGDDASGQFTCAGPITGVLAEGGESEDFIFTGGDAPAVLRGNAGDDMLYATGAAERLEGGDGDDSLNTGDRADVLIGGAGDDSLVSDPIDYGEEAGPPAGAADTLDGGPGRDSFEGGAGADTITGGDGRDSVSYTGGAVTVSLAGGAGEDTLSGIEVVYTDAKDDTLTGDDRFNELHSGAGNDTLDGGRGSDLLDAGEGDDTVLARDGMPDDISCGPGADRVVADPDDFVDGDCETVERAAIPAAGPPPLPAPVLQVSGRYRKHRLMIGGRVVPPSGTDASACTGGGVTISISGIAKKLRRVGTVLRSNCTYSVRVRASKRVARRARFSASFAGTPRLGAATTAPTRVRR